MAVDRTHDGHGEPANYWVPITPNDSTDLDPMPRSIYIGTAGAIRFVDAAGDTRTVTTMIAGYHPTRPRRIHSTGTTATDIWGLF